MLLDDYKYQLIKNLTYSVQELLRCKELYDVEALDPETEYTLDDIVALISDIEEHILDGYF